MSRRLHTAILLALSWVLAAQQTRLEIQVVEGSAAVHSAGYRSANPLVVRVVDGVGDSVKDAVVSFQLPAEGPAGVFENGLATQIVATGADGRAVMPTVRYNRLPGPFQVRVTAAKHQTRAGILVDQRLVDAPPPRQGGKRWWLAGVAAAGAAVATLALVRKAPGSSGGPPSAGMPAVTIGSPTITIWKP